MGEVILFDELYNKIFDIILKETKKRHPKWDKTKKVSGDITMGTIKYGMLNKDVNTRVVFDWEEALKFEGETGPYLQYSYARANSILRKSKPKKFDLNSLKEEKEIQLLRMLIKYPEVIDKAARDLRPHYLTTYLFELSELFNTFYQKYPVLKSEKNLKEARLKLVESFKQVLESGLKLLGIPIIKKM
jgi:arginyl-tRNA synthetase